ncbi:hypothetical protein KSP40_PGU017468 [Platanthera guangdongensis]|uniref:SOSEKI DIX-like domain-containing protein n=1 Tax=Platanthera guangdongensis TaxID=2320717 RepID=A0ABR2LML9_9ASPA
MMEGRGRRYAAQVSPERSKVWTEPPPKHHIQRPQGRRVPVVYYLCKNRHLDHPHFIEVPISSPEGLHLKDVINRLVVLRGKRMPVMYSWSCKRSYKNGFVWQDLSEDDLILPAHGNEYILKGSELLDQTPPDRLQDSGNSTLMENHMPSQLDSSEVLQPSSSYSSPIISAREGKSSSSPPQPTPPPPQEDDSPVLPYQNSSQGTGSPNFGECTVFIPNGAQDASTQTDDSGDRMTRPEPDILADIVSAGDDLSNVKYNESRPNHYAQSDDAIKKETSPNQTPSSASSGPKIDTLESLIRSEVNKFNSFRLIEEEEEVVPRKAKMKRINPLLQLLTCGSTLVKDHHKVGFIRAYKPSFLNLRLGPTFPSSMTVRELEYMSEGPRVVRLGTERRDSCSRNLCDNHLMQKDEGGRESSPSFNCTPFYNREDISYKSPDLKENKEKDGGLVGSNGSTSPIQILSGKTVVTFRSPTLHDAKSSQAQQIHCKSPSASSFGASKRIVNVNSSGEESFQEENERMIKIEES